MKTQNVFYIKYVLPSMQKTLKNIIKFKKQYITSSSLKFNIQLKPGEILDKYNIF